MDDHRDTPYDDEHRNEGKCAGCDDYAELDGLGLCDTCTAKLDRDMIRMRDWDYSVSAFGVPHDKREELRNHVIKTHGRSMELIADEAIEKQCKEKRDRKKAKRKKQRRKTEKA